MTDSDVWVLPIDNQNLKAGTMCLLPHLGSATVLRCVKSLLVSGLVSSGHRRASIGSRSASGFIRCRLQDTYSIGTARHER
jgi:hypothetical protein